MFWQSRLASLDDMLANIVHQWRQPLTELKLTIFTLKKSALNSDEEKVQKYYDESSHIIKNMSQTIDDFTNFFRPDKEKQHFKVSENISSYLVYKSFVG